MVDGDGCQAATVGDKLLIRKNGDKFELVGCQIAYFGPTIWEMRNANRYAH